MTLMTLAKAESIRKCNTRATGAVANGYGAMICGAACYVRISGSVRAGEILISATLSLLAGSAINSFKNND